ncbi:hypothetical protein C8J57DRAFT_1255464 [Mycena rebaudengoi]|nr:hypothetical protein C8J57DRAFT_1255464 [Mycena rebaudengoi]
MQSVPPKNPRLLVLKFFGNDCKASPRLHLERAPTVPRARPSCETDGRAKLSCDEMGGGEKKRITAEGIHSGRVKCRCAYLCNEAAAQSTNFVHCSVCLEGVPACVDNFTLRRRTSEFNASPDPIKVPINQEQTTCSSYSR